LLRYVAVGLLQTADDNPTDADQPLSEADQIASDTDQTASDADQIASDADQIASDADQRASDEDQAASDEESLEGADRHVRVRGSAHRDRAAADRTTAAADRDRAAADRAKAAEERAHSAHDRSLAARDRAEAARDREASETDELTKVRRRGAGMKQLQREIDRARRGPEELVVAFVDVDGLKQVNDTDGHLAGDALLVAVADSTKACLRSYDLIMRFGGDEFVCVLPHAGVETVRERFTEVSNTLAAGVTGGSITVGFAALDNGDSPEDLIRRADHDLLAHRENS
jgi:diguanylate cyclase (GGDEF)-like protein